MAVPRARDGRSSQPRPARGLRQSVAALHHPNFARFWTGALVSNIGTWMQNVTVPYVIYDRTHSAALVGVAGFCQFFPAMILGPVGGSLADRYPRRSVLLVTQSLMAALAFALWGLYVAGLASTPVLILLVFLGGVVAGINVPAWQAFVAELVPRDSLLNAVTLNSAQFNAARAVGPALAGAVLAIGPSWAFLANGVSYAAVIVALLLIRLAPKVEAAVTERHLFREFAESLRYTRDNRGMLLAVLLVGAVAFLGNPLFQLIPVFAKDVFHVGAGSYGVLTGALGAGGVIGAVLLGSLGNVERRGRLIGFALLFYAVSVASFALAPTFALGLVAMACAGMAFLTTVASLNTSVQLLVPESLRGRVMALYIMMFTGAYPLGSLVQGALADRIGARATVAGAGTILAAIAGFMAMRPRLLGLLDERRDADADDVDLVEAAAEGGDVFVPDVDIDIAEAG
jgi:MFS family permease